MDTVTTKENKKQVGGIWVDPNIFDEFKKLAKGEGLKPTEKIAEMIEAFVSKNSEKKSVWIDRTELIELIRNDENLFLHGFAVDTIEIKLVEMQDDFPEDCVKGGSKRGKNIFYHKDKTIKFLKAKK